MRDRASPLRKTDLVAPPVLMRGRQFAGHAQLDGAYHYSAQYQQNPMPVGGAMIKTN